MMADRMPDHTITMQTRMNCALMAVPPIPVLQDPIGVRHAPEATPAVVVILGKLQPETATKATTSQELLF